MSLVVYVHRLACALLLSSNGTSRDTRAAMNQALCDVQHDFPDLYHKALEASQMAGRGGDIQAVAKKTVVRSYWPLCREIVQVLKLCTCKQFFRTFAKTEAELGPERLAKIRDVLAEAIVATNALAT